jgi:hypothetical protein
MANAQQEQIQRVTTLYNEAAHKLDYFILGATLAICAYLAQTNPYGQIGINKETFLLASLLVFAVSAAYGLRRIESAISLIRINVFILNQTDAAKLEKLGTKFLTEADKGLLHGRLRNYLLAAGLLCYVTTKVWASYQNTGWILIH